MKTEINIRLLAATFVLAFAAGAFAQPAAIRSKKLVELGWDMPSTADVRKNIAVMEQQPFDGIMIRVIGTDDAGKPIHLSTIHEARPWKESWFAGAVADLKATQFKNLTDNFASIGANPGNVDWFDDAGWKNIVDHFRIAARVARQAGLKGLCYDAEPYTEPFKQFVYLAQPQRAQHSFKEYWAKARQRGREVMGALAQEYPGMVLLTVRLNTDNIIATGHGDPQPLLISQMFGLMAPFADGWLDAVPPTMTIVDGGEAAYLYNSPGEYLELANQVKTSLQDLVSPENRAKYRAQVQAGFGMYLDAYTNKAGSSIYYIPPSSASRVDQLAFNTATALRVADEYVWVYGEQHRWWPYGNNQRTTWEEALPGITSALNYVRNPQEMGLRRVAELQAQGKLMNLALNGDFAAGPATAAAKPNAADWVSAGAPAKWSTWQEKEKEGTFSWDPKVGATAPGAARVSGCSGGCFIQTYDVKPGERYFLSTLGRTQGNGVQWIRARWQTPDGKWIDPSLDKLFLPNERGPVAGTPTGWGQMAGSVTVPAAAGKLVLLVTISGQLSPQDVAWFDDARVYNLQ